MVVVLLVLSLSLLFFLKIRKTKLEKRRSEDLNLSMQDESLPNPNDKRIIEQLPNETGYRLYCQVYLNDLYYPGDVFGDFIIQAAAPCWYFDSNGDLNSIEIPMVIEDTSSQLWAHISSSQFIPIFNMDKATAIRGFSKYPFSSGIGGAEPII